MARPAANRRTQITRGVLFMDFQDFIGPHNVDHAMNSLEIILYESWPGRMPPDLWDVIRRYVLSRDRYTCANCKATNTRLDAHHIVPISAGGTNHTTNIKTLCYDCHCKIHPHMKDKP